MIWLNMKVSTEDLSHLEIKTYLGIVIRKFWQFSCFYGDYMALPPSQRRKWLNSYKSNANSIPLKRF
jgi:hypothetical protein